MLTTIAEKCAAFILQDDNREDVLAVCAYGIELALYTILSTCGLLLIGWIFNRLFEILIIIAFYYTNQTVGGGFHASSHLRCFSMMSIGLLVCISTLNLSISVATLIVLLHISLIILWIYPVELHPNKEYLVKNLPKLQRNSRVVSLISYQVVLVLILQCKQINITNAASFGILVSAISRGLGHLSYLEEELI